MLNTEPAGTYYSFYFAQSTSKSWDELFTIRFDEKKPIPKNQVKFLDNQKAFAFIGWVFAATTNGGQNWRIWDAEEDLPGWKCCNPSLIQSVEIGLDGIGSMALKPTPQRLEEVLTLHTKDYGQHWTQ